MTNIKYLPFTIKDIEEMLSEGYVRMTKHPERPLYIYNYTAKAQYEGKWNSVTMLCRGLILDEDYKIMARPFTKFFNLGEVSCQSLPLEQFEVYEKMDGSLGILYWWNEKPYLATRGSFISDQAIKANELLHGKYGQLIQRLDRSKTYLFEIIYPQNRIVINYGSKEELVLLAIIDMVSGHEMPLENVGFPIAKRYDGMHDLQILQTVQSNNMEGFVVKFEGGFRIKVKFDEYVRLHKILTNVSSRTIWEHLRNQHALDEILNNVPDEFYAWVRLTMEDFKKAFKQIEDIAKEEFKILEDRKSTALYFLTCKYPAILFKMLEGKSYDFFIWKLLKPKYERPFKKFQDE